MVTFDKDGNPQSCDGCQQRPNPFVEQPPGAGYIGELAICADCGYAACSECQGHGCAAGMRCSGHGACKCTNCNQELQRRRLHEMRTGVFMGVDPITHELAHNVQHHQLARGTCFCHNSNFGKAYSDVYSRSDLSSCVFGTKNSEKAYAGPRKSVAQIALEKQLLDENVPAFPLMERRCMLQSCSASGAAASLRCSRCRSVWYCSAMHQVCFYPLAALT